MTSAYSLRRRRLRGQQGYLLMVILFMLFLLMLVLVAVAPRIAQQIRRDREEETIHRGNQYVRAIRRFYRKFGRYPTSLDELQSTNNLRFLRRRYKDPLAPDGDWRIIHFGEAKVTLKGFGPQSLTPGSTPPGTATTGTTGSAPQSGMGTPPSSMAGPAAGPTLGGGPIIGVAPNSKEASIKELNGQNHYNEWEFVYDPRLDLTNQPGAVPGAVPGGAPGGPQPGPQQQPPPSMGPGMGPK